MKLPEDSPKYGSKHVAVLNKTSVNNYIGLFWNICCANGQIITNHYIKQSENKGT
jgi:hypothetical protein